MALGTITEKELRQNLLAAHVRRGHSTAATAALAAASASAASAASATSSGDCNGPRFSQSPMSEKISKYIIEAKCTDNILFAGAAAVGAVVLVLQSFPIFMNNWVFLTEPRLINKTNENGEQMESTFHYNVGYFQVCRMYRNNQSGIVYNEYEVSKSESAYKCYLNPLLSREDLTDQSVASLAVIMRLGLPALLHITGAFICCFAFVLGVTGHLRKTFYTLLSCINYICGSIILCIAVLMVVCVVDDELAPRMKPNSAGEPSKFSYIYGFPFFSSALSFLPVQVCACLQAFLYFSAACTVGQGAWNSSFGIMASRLFGILPSTAFIWNFLSTLTQRCFKCTALEVLRLFHQTANVQKVKKKKISTIMKATGEGLRKAK